MVAGEKLSLANSLDNDREWEGAPLHTSLHSKALTADEIKHASNTLNIDTPDPRYVATIEFGKIWLAPGLRSYAVISLPVALPVDVRVNLEAPVTDPCALPRVYCGAGVA